MVMKQTDPIYTKVLNIPANMMASKYIKQKEQNGKHSGKSTTVMGNCNVSLRKRWAEQIKLVRN